MNVVEEGPYASNPSDNHRYAAMAKTTNEEAQGINTGSVYFEESRQARQAPLEESSQDVVAFSNNDNDEETQAVRTLTNEVRYTSPYKQ